MKKKVLLGAFIGIFLSTTFVTYAATLSVDVPNGATERIAITGKILSDSATAIADNLIVVTVINPDKTLDKIDNETINYTMQTTSNTKGEYSINYVIDDTLSQSGEYTVVVSGASVAEMVSSKFYYATLSDKQLAILQLNTATSGEQVKLLFEQPKFARILSLDTIGFYSKLDDTHKLVLYQKLADATFSGDTATSDKANVIIGTIGNTFKSIAEDTYKIQTEQAVVTQIKNTSATDVVGLIEQNNDIIKIDFTNFEKLGIEGKANVGTGLVSRKSYFVDFASIKKAFEEEVAIAAINEVPRANAADKMKDVISRNNSVLGLSFGSLSEKQKTTVYIQLASKSFKSIQEIKNAFNSAVSDVTNPPTGNNSSGGGGGGGSTISAQISITPVVPVQNANTLVFNDIATVPWAQESITALVNKKIVNGNDDGSFEPNTYVTREQFIKMLVGALNLLDETAVTDFRDVNSQEWYYKYIASAQKSSLVDGLGDGKFGIGFNISRQDMAVMVYRAAMHANVSLSADTTLSNFADSGEIGEYAIKSVGFMQQAKIINGTDGNRFAPKDYATRAQAVKVIYEFMKLF